MTFGSTGAQYTPEIDVASQVEGEAAPDRWRQLCFRARAGVARLTTQGRLITRLLRGA